MGLQAADLIRDYFSWKCGTGYSIDRTNDCHYTGVLWRSPNGHDFRGTFNMVAKSPSKIIAYVHEYNSFKNYNSNVLNQAIEYANRNCLILNVYFGSLGFLYLNNTWAYVADFDIYTDTTFEDFRKRVDACINASRTKILTAVDKYWELM